MKYDVVACGILIAAAACAHPPLTPIEEPIQNGAALGRTIERDANAPVQTDSLVYHLTAEGNARRVDIPFRYRNDTGRRISVVNCRGGLNISLEKRVGGRWEPYYSPVLLACLSPPIEIEPAAVYAATAEIYGVLPGFNAVPAFASAQLSGEYRLVWSNLVHSYDDRRQGFGDPVGPLRSNPFLLVAPGD